MPSLKGPSDDGAEPKNPRDMSIVRWLRQRGLMPSETSPDRTVAETIPLFWDRMTGAAHSEQKLSLAAAHWLGWACSRAECGEMPDPTVPIVWNDTCLPSSELSQIDQQAPV
jgi:hypothetical protein